MRETYEIAIQRISEIYTSADKINHSIPVLFSHLLKWGHFWHCDHINKTKIKYYYLIADLIYSNISTRVYQ